MPADASPTPSFNRLAALRRSGLLERGAREHFDHLTEHVRLTLGVPVAIVSIVDEDRQVFAGHCGLPEPWASLGQTPISHSFCQHVVEQGRVLSVHDARAEPLVRNNLAIGDLGVVAYLGVPIHLPGGELVGALAAIDTQPREWTAHDLSVLESIAIIVDKEIRVGLSELKYRTLIEDMREGFYVGRAVRDTGGNVVDLVLEEVNPSFERLTGAPASRTTNARLSMLTPASLEGMLPTLRRVLDDGVQDIYVHPSSLAPGRWFENRLSPLDGDRVAGFFSDVTVRREDEARQEVLHQEMSHRLKNTLMMVQALALQTLKPVSERVHVEALEKRIQALSVAHDILFLKHWQGAPIRDVCVASLGRLCVDGRVDLSGDVVELGPKATLSLSLLLHELATNAIKYGALSNGSGRILLSWDADAVSNVLHLRWKEVGGPAVVAPVRKGFGSKLIAMGLGTGRVTVDYAPDGLFLDLSAPLSTVQQVTM